MENEKKTPKKMKWWTKILLGLVIFVSILLIAYPFLRDGLLKYTSQVSLPTIETVKKNENIEFKTEEILPVSDKDIVTNINWNIDNVVGALYMPTIDSSMMITRGFTNQSMWSSIGTMKDNQVMGGENNYVLAGHNMFIPKVLFSDLEKLKIGDSIYVTDVEYLYEYTTTESYKAKVSETDFMSDHVGKREITLFTCTPDAYENDYEFRWLTRGELISKIPIEEAPSNVKKVFKL